jgi:hypothetical protein
MIGRHEQGVFLGFTGMDEKALTKVILAALEVSHFYPHSLLKLTWQPQSTVQ